jgi:hypothetical protein
MAVCMMQMALTHKRLAFFQNRGIIQADLTTLRLQQKPPGLQTSSLRQFRRLLG